MVFCIYVHCRWRSRRDESLSLISTQTDTSVPNAEKKIISIPFERVSRIELFRWRKCLTVVISHSTCWNKTNDNRNQTQPILFVHLSICILWTYYRSSNVRQCVSHTHPAQQHNMHLHNSLTRIIIIINIYPVILSLWFIRLLNRIDR